jgi:hypothetical protein
MSRLALWTVLAVALLAPALGAEEAVKPADAAAIAKRLAPSFVRVEYTLQFDGGEAPKAAGWGKRCPNCGAFHSIGIGDLVEEERPLEFNGYVISPTQVVTPDVNIHPRFVKQTTVRLGDRRVGAKIAAWALDQDAVLLELAEPLQGAEPLQFNPDAGPPAQAVSSDVLNGTWTLTVEPAAITVSVTAEGESFASLPANSLLVTGAGVPVALPMAGEGPVDDSWKVSPLKWPTLGADAMAKLLADLEDRASRGLLHVALTFRSPKQQGSSTRARFGSEEDEDATERHVIGVLVDEKTVLVLANLRPKITGRLERIQVRPASGEAVAAKFAGSLADYGAFVATLEKPLPGPLALAAGPIRPYRKTLLLGAEVRLQGEKRVAHFQPRRVAGIGEGWRQHLYFTVPGEADALFLFDRAGALAAVPVARREKVATERSYQSESRNLTPVVYLKEVLADLAAHADPGNVPLSEQEENRLAWTGVELQGLTPELARVNHVSDQTEEGRNGAIVSYVYPDSPAAKAGIQPGDIILRIRVEGQPKPIEVRIEEDRFSEGFPWDRLDEVPEQYYDRIPQPWPAAGNAVAQALTEVGFGKKFTVEFYRDGKAFEKQFEIVESPPHYESAARKKVDALGLTVRDLTYEVRRYFQKKPDEPGVIVSRIEPGSKASVAGIKPYEIITHVNESPVMNVGGFEKLTGAKGELRLSVKRMAQGRVVKITTAPGETPPAKPPAAPEEPDE